MARDGAVQAQVEQQEIDLVLHLVASGLTEASRLVARGEPLTLPYPAGLQRGLDHLTLLCLQHRALPPAGVPELIRFCHGPLGDWPVPFGVPSDLDREVLMDRGIPTRVCEEWAVTSPDVEAELFERQVVEDVRRACRAAGRQDSYVAFRHLVITRPVLTELEFQRQLMDSKYAVIAGPLKRCYPLAPAECEVDGFAVTCADCNNLLVRSVSGLECINDRCTRTGAATPGRRVPLVEGVRWLASPVRTFVASPGQAEVRLRDEIVNRGAEATLWPDFDAFDLLITFPHDGPWAVDVKDWANPYLLARHVRPVPRPQGCTQAFIVPAREAVRARPGYLQTLRRRARRRLQGTGTVIRSEQRLLTEVQARIPEAERA